MFSYSNTALNSDVKRIDFKMTETSFKEVDYHHSNNNEIELLMYKQDRI